MKQSDPSRAARDALHEAEARFHTAFQAAPIGMALASLGGRYLQVNPALCELLGHEEQEMVGVNWRDLTHPDDIGAQEEYERSALEGDPATFRMEKRYLRPDGGIVWAVTSRALVRDPDGEPLYFISQVVDISERRGIEARLREREEETRRILETAQDAFIGMDAEGRVSDWNRQAELAFGWTVEEAIGRQLAELIIPERFRDQHRRGLSHFLATGEGKVLNRRLELTGLRRSGEEFPVELSIWPLASGGAVRFNAFVHDISERVQAQDELSRQAEELQALHETTLDLIRRLEPTSLLQAILVRAASLMRTEHGYIYVLEESAGELVVRAGIGAFADYTGYRLQQGEGLAGRVWEAGEPISINDYQTWEGRRAEFEFIHAAVALPLRAGTGIVGVLGLTHVEEERRFDVEDIDLLTRFGRLASLVLDNARLYSSAQQELRERRRAEKELERSADELRQANEDLLAADEMKTHFVAVTSHELRTPLTSVLGFARTLRKNWDRLADDARREQIALIEEQAARLSRLVEELLTMSRIDAGALDVHTVEVDVEAAIRQAVAAFGEDGARIEVSETNGVRAAADPDHLQQILVNYLANALRHGAPPVRVEASATNGSVEIVVADAGSGVPPAFVPRLFQKFAQARDSGGGTGLGLSIVRGLAVALGGDAWYEPGSPGARFGVRLPAV
jgi:PAS domain S-box-containing protein